MIPVDDRRRAAADRRAALDAVVAGLLRHVPDLAGLISNIELAGVAPRLARAIQDRLCKVRAAYQGGRQQPDSSVWAERLPVQSPVLPKAKTSPLPRKTGTGATVFVSATGPPGWLTREMMAVAQVVHQLPLGGDVDEFVSVGIDGARHGQITVIIESDDPNSDIWEPPEPDMTRVGKAIYDANKRPDSPAWPEASPAAQAWARRAAAAAIRALRP